MIVFQSYISVQLFLLPFQHVFEIIEENVYV